MAKGKFIVIDGIDGSGKATQTQLLLENLNRRKIKTKKIDFPRYDTNFFGALIGKCLTGERGDFVNIDPHIGSVLYAADRWESSSQIKKWLDKGYFVLADRYVSSNQIHQGGKIKDPKKREKFLQWLSQMEYEVFKIPKPDLIVFLNLPVTLNQQLLKQRQATGGDTKKYLEGKKDIVEEDLKYLQDGRTSAMKLVRKDNKWKMIECSKKGKILSKEEISMKVCQIVLQELGLKK